MSQALQTTATATATMLTAVVAGVAALPLAGPATADRTLDERRAAALGADTNPFANAREEARLTRPVHTPALIPDNDVARKSGDESAAVTVADDPVTRAPITPRARGPPHAEQR